MAKSLLLALEVDARQHKNYVPLAVEQTHFVVINALACFGLLKGYQYRCLVLDVFAVVARRVEVFKLDCKFFFRIYCDNAIDNIAAGITMYRLHSRIYDQPHVRFENVGPIHFGSLTLLAFVKIL